MKKTIYAALAALSLALATTSCGDFLSEYSQDMVVAKTVYHMDEVLLGDGYIRSTKMSNGPTASYTAGFLNILDDDLNCGNAGSQTAKAWGSCLSNMYGYFAWQLRVGSNFNGSYFRDDASTWNDLYRRINVVNVILDEIVDLPHETTEDEAAYYRVQGECHFLRGQFYFMLANLYGNAYNPATCETDLCVPLKLTTYVEQDKDKDTQFERATVKAVYDNVVNDLLVAKDYLTKSPQPSAHRLHRASAEAVELLLSRVYLYMQQWEKAEAEASLVISSKETSLCGINDFNADQPFLYRDNAEVIFTQGHNMLTTPNIFTGAAGDFCVSKELRDMFDDQDARTDCFFGTDAAGDSAVLKNKYERIDNASHISDVFTLRTSEAWLNKAEACAMQSGKEGTANAILNEFRAYRINNYEPQSYSAAELVNQIRDERRKEFCFEGHRWFDLRRYAVNEKYPFSKVIMHVFHVCGDFGIINTELYRLEANDPAYTFALPESVIKFDKVPMPDNPRQERKAIVLPKDEPDDEPDDEPIVQG